MTIKEYFKVLGSDGEDVIDKTIESPYCFIDNIEENDLSDDYYKFIYYIITHIEAASYNKDSCIGAVVTADFQKHFEDNLDKWIKFTDETRIESYTRNNFDNDQDFMYDALPAVLESMLVGNDYMENYTLFLQIFEEEN